MGDLVTPPDFKISVTRSKASELTLTTTQTVQALTAKQFLLEHHSRHADHGNSNLLLHCYEGGQNNYHCRCDRIHYSLGRFDCGRHGWVGVVVCFDYTSCCTV